MTPEPTPSQELRKKLGLLISKHEAIPQVSYHHAGDTIDGSPIYEADDQKTAYKKWQKSFTDDLIEFIKQHELSRKQEWAEKYDELIMEVGYKYAGETRHETALRYIKSCENSSNTQSKTIKEEEK